MIQRVLPSDYHKGDEVPQADPKQPLSHFDPCEQPVFQNVESHFICEFSVGVRGMRDEMRYHRSSKIEKWRMTDERNEGSASFR